MKFDLCQTEPDCGCEGWLECGCNTGAVRYFCVSESLEACLSHIHYDPWEDSLEVVETDFGTRWIRAYSHNDNVDLIIYPQFPLTKASANRIVKLIEKKGMSHDC
jgi:hypothetical protein